MMMTKSFLLGIMLLLGCSLPADARRPQTNKAGQNSDAPQFAFKGGDIHNFGNIPEGPDATHVFEFMNVGKTPLIIQNASASCGCTSPEWPKEPVLPGKTGTITVRYKTAGRGNAPFDKQVYITSNAVSETEKYVLHIRGFVTAADDGSGKK